MKPIISFCIPTYNRAELVKRCVQNILEFDGEAIEVVVSNNSSPDNTEEVISSIRDNRISYYRNSENIGAVLNIIETIKKARGEWVFTLSDEDIVTVKIIKKLLAILKSDYCNNAAVIFGNMRKVYNDQHIKYLNAKYKKGDQAIINVGFLHLYLSGILIKKEYIDLPYINNYSVDSGGMYPFVNIFSLACKKGDAITLDTEICINGDRVNKKSFIERPGDKSFKHPDNRFRQFQIFTNIANDIINSEDLKIFKLCLIYDHFLKLSTYHWENILKKDSEYYQLSDYQKFDFNESLSKFYNGAVNHFKSIIHSDTTFDSIHSDIKMKNFILEQRRKEFLDNQINKQ